MTSQLASEVRKAIEVTVSHGSARVALYLPLDTPVPTSKDLRGEGIVEFGTRRARVTERMLTERMLEERRDTDTDRVRRLKTGFAQPMEHMYDGGRRYAHRGEGVWLSDGEDVDGPRHGANPLWALDALLGANEDATEIPGGAVRGEDTRAVRLTLSLWRANELCATGVPLPSRRQRLLMRHRPYEPPIERMPAQVWLDASSTLRRMSVATPIRPSKRARHVVWHVAELWDFGIESHITAPTPR